MKRRTRMVIELAFRRPASCIVEGFRVYNEKIVAPVLLGNVRPPVWTDCLFDTGAHVSIFPAKVWRRCASSIRWAEKQKVIPGWLQRFTGAAGGEVACRVGVLPIAIYDRSFRHSLATDILALFTTRDDFPPVSLLGLGGGVLDQVVVHIDYAVPKAWLEVKGRPA